MLKYFKLLTSTIALMSLTSTTNVEAGACKPVTLVMTRASGSRVKHDGEKWITKFPLSTVNLANVNGALKFIITETIDTKAGYTNTTEDGCHRKNWVNYIHFYKFTVCNPDAALWWFNQRKAGYGGEPEAYNYGEYGYYLTMDDGQCHDNDYCKSLVGADKTPLLGQFVGWQDVSTDVRNPTQNAYWYSAPGECPLMKWAKDPKKTDECKKKQISGKCKDGEIPDGDKCTWQYELLGQVNLDELVGITSIKNNKTGENFKDAEEYCLAGNIEFERSENKSFVRGLDFWKDPLDENANAERITKLLEFYGKQENNTALPTTEELLKSNPRCYESSPGCFDGKAETCTRDDSMLCVPCDKVKGGCKAVPAGAKGFPQLEAVEVPKDGGVNGKNTSGSDDSSDEASDANVLPLHLFSLYLISLFGAYFL